MARAAICCKHLQFALRSRLDRLDDCAAAITTDTSHAAMLLPKVFGIVTSSTAGAAALSSCVEVINLWVLALFDTAVPDGDLDQLAQHVVRVTHGSEPTPIDAVQALPSVDLVSAGSIDYARRLRTLARFVQNFSLAEPTSDYAQNVLLNLGAVIRRNRLGLSGEEQNHYMGFAGAGVGAIVSELSSLLCVTFPPPSHRPLSTWLLVNGAERWHYPALFLVCECAERSGEILTGICHTWIGAWFWLRQRMLWPLVQ